MLLCPNKEKMEQIEKLTTILRFLKMIQKYKAIHSKTGETGEYRQSWLSGAETLDQKPTWEPMLEMDSLNYN